MTRSELYQDAALSAFHAGKQAHCTAAGCCAAHLAVVVGILWMFGWSGEVCSGVLSGNGC